MIGRIFRRTSREDEVFAEAQALIDDGLELAFVLDLYPEDAAWLTALLDTGIVIGESFAAEEPSYYFEASLKTRFVEAGMERAARAAAPVHEPVAVVPSAPAAGGFFRLQGAVAGTAVAVVLGGMSLLTLGVVTAGDSVPGDWNYAFKLAGERIEYSLSTGDARTDVQIRHTMERVQEFQRLNQKGKVSEKNVEDVRKGLDSLSELVEEEELDPLQRETAKAIAESASQVLTTTRETQPELAPRIDDTIAVAAGIGSAATGIAAPTATATPTAATTPPNTATPATTPKPTGTAEPSETPEPATTPDPASTPEAGETAETGETGEDPGASPSAQVTGSAADEELP
ncbi:MAG: hypothetical protein KC470_09540 [Dehalococcoidia bacterium]|nr:hypothetical protein [Dehalococcoidia bacterium]